MSPSSKELVSNKALTGAELAKIIMRDTADILSQSCMLTNHIAYGRVAYEIRVTMHMDNPSMPTSVETIRSKGRSDNEIAADPSLAAIETAPPLASPSEEAYVSSIERHRDINSPNAARIEHGLPVTVLSRQNDGHTIENQVLYPPDEVNRMIEDGTLPGPIDADLTRMVKDEFANGTKL